MVTAPSYSDSGSLYVLSAPSGVGKTALVRALLLHDDRVLASVSHTTRAPRADEKDGQNYYFVDETTFLHMQDEQEFLESAQVFGHHYGTSKRWVERQLRTARDVLLEIDWQGARQIRKLYPDCLSIFILPPDRQALEQRLLGRGQHGDEVERLKTFDAEMSHYREYDYILVNEDLSYATKQLQAIFLSHRLHYATHRNTHDRFVQQLMGDSRQD